MLKKIAVVVCILLIGTIGFETQWLQKNKPLCKNCNVLLISLDTLSAKHLPCYGYDKDTAPNLCQFGKDNILFTNSYAQSNWTRPSQTSVLTGLHPSTHGVLTAYIDKLSPQYKTIQETLKADGYKTYYFGQPIDNTSWDESVIKGFDVMEDDIYIRDSLNHWQKALEILEQNKKSKIPTFMYLHTYYVHAPYLPGEKNLKFISKENQDKYPELPLAEENYHKRSQKMKEFVISLLEERVFQSGTKENFATNKKMLDDLKSTKTQADIEKFFELLPSMERSSYEYSYYLETASKLNNNEYVGSIYDEKISQLDAELKQFLDKINNKFAKDTVVVIYSDHGEVLGERGGFGHCYGNFVCLYNEIARVPLIIKVPGIKNREIKELSQGIDIFPTIMKLIGKNRPQNLEGESLVELIKNKLAKSEKTYIVSEDSGFQKIVVDNKWKLYLKDYRNITPNTIELYDLENDLYEQKNLAKENTEMVNIKLSQLKEFMSQNKKTNHLNYDFPDWIDNAKREKLIKEGYF